MAVAFDANATAPTKNGGVTTLDNGNLTVGSGSNRALIAFIALNNNTSVSGIAWDPVGTNQAMTLLGQIGNSGGGWSTQCGIWGLRAPTSGNKICRVTFAAAADNAILNCASFTGVSQTSDATAFPTASVQTNSNVFAGGSGASSYTITVPSNVGDAVAGLTAAHFAGLSPATLTQLSADYENNFGAISIFGLSNASPMPIVVGGADPGGGNSDPHTMVGINMAAAGGGGGSGTGGGLLLFGGSVGWTPLLGAAAAWKAGSAIRRNATLGRRGLMLGKW